LRRLFVVKGPIMRLPDVTTERLQLSRWDARVHGAGLEALNARPDAVRYLNDGVPYTPAESAAQSARFAAHWAEHGFGLWGATLLFTGEVIGFVGLAHPLWFPARAHEVEVGWRLHPAFWGKGYATEAGHAALAAASTHLGLTRVIAVIDPGNTPSIAVATRLGLTLQARVPHPQRPGSVDIYATELPAARQVGP
jgi:RimJ/RimL family protein N-acetyltransferase